MDLNMNVESKSKISSAKSEIFICLTEKIWLFYHNFNNASKLKKSAFQIWFFFLHLAKENNLFPVKWDLFSNSSAKYKILGPQYLFHCLCPGL